MRENRLQRVCQQRYQSQQRYGGQQLRQSAEGLRQVKIQNQQQRDDHNGRHRDNADHTCQLFRRCFDLFRWGAHVFSPLGGLMIAFPSPAKPAPLS